MFTSSIKRKFDNPGEGYKICKKIRSERPWNKLYLEKHNLHTSYTIKYYNDKSEKIGNFIPDQEIESGELSIVDSGQYLKYDPFFYFQKNVNCEMKEYKKAIKEISLYNSMERVCGVPTIITKGDDFTLHEENGVLVCESQNISYPTNVRSGQSIKYYIKISYDKNILTLFGLTKTVVPINCVGMWYGKDLLNYFEGKHSIWDGDYKSTEEKHIIKDYCIAVKNSQKYLSNIGVEEEEEKPGEIFEIENYITDDVCSKYIKIFEENKNKTIIDKNIISVISTFNDHKNNIRQYSTELFMLNKFFNPVDTVRILKYEKGVESMMHTDRPEFNELSTHRFLIYLSDFEGGDLEFENHAITSSKQKMAIFNLNMPHRSPMVTKGVKYIITGELTKKF